MICNMFAIGCNLQEIRKSKKLTQLEMAEELNVSLTHYSKIEQGIDKMSMDVIFKIMTVLDIDANTLLIYGKSGNENVSRVVAKISTLDTFDQDTVINGFEAMVDTMFDTEKRRKVS